MDTRNGGRVARVLVAGQDSPILVPITSANKPHVSEELAGKWQHTLDLAARIIGVPAGLIMRLEEDRIEVFLASRTEENPYHPQESDVLQSGLYCETVAGTREKLMVPNALSDPLWRENPDVALNMISYLGAPIQWPDGEVFGTFCLLDREEHNFPPLHQELLDHMREIIEGDLKLLVLYDRLQKHSDHKEFQLREIHHRVKNHFNIVLSSISLQRTFDNAETTIESVLDDIHSRVSAISEIHEHLYKANDLEHVSLGTYIEEVCSRIINNLDPGRIAFSCDAEEVTARPRVSVPCGLLLSELITNSIKHAFSTTVRPEIAIRVARGSSGDIIIEYRDNGRGIPDSVDPENAMSLGMTLIRHLAGQLGGTLSVRNDSGVYYRLVFH